MALVITATPATFDRPGPLVVMTVLFGHKIEGLA